MKKTITFADFISIIDAYFEGIVYPFDSPFGNENGKKGLQGQPDHIKLVEYVSLFVRDEENDRDYLPQSEEMLRKVFNGAKELPRAKASAILSQLSDEHISNAASQLSPEAKEGLIDAFEKKGEMLLGLDLGRELTEVLKDILERISSLNRTFWLGKVEIIGDLIRYGGKTFRMTPALTPPIKVAELEARYVEALLAVYSQDFNSSKPIKLKDLDKPCYLEYKEDFILSRDDFYKVSTVFRRLRDSFYDGEDQFDLAKEEALELISYVFVGVKAGFQRLKECRNLILEFKFKKSDLGRPEIKMMGPAENRGLLHVLVNDGKITWIKEGEYEDECL